MELPSTGNMILAAFGALFTGTSLSVLSSLFTPKKSKLIES